MRGFTLLEVMVALAIMAGVLLTVISSVNYHISVLAADRDETTAVLLARQKLDELGLAGKVEKEGSFAPDHPEISWETATTPTGLPGVNRMVLTVTWGAGKKLSLAQYR